MNDSPLRVVGLAKRYGSVAAVTDVSFSLKRGAVTVFLGENGAGKTTTIKCFLGFLTPASGMIDLKADRVGYVSEQPVFFPWLKGREILAATARLYGIHPEFFQWKTRKLSETLAFDTELLSRKVQTYSRGNQKKFAYLQSLVISPDFLVVDEPFSGLDPLSIKKTRDLFLDLRRERKTVFLSSHLISEVEKFADDIIIIKKGKIVMQANWPELKRTNILVRLKKWGLEMDELTRATPFVKERETEYELLIEKKRLENLINTMKWGLSGVTQDNLDLETVFLFLTR